MTTSANYTPQEWRLLVQAPVMAGMAIILTPTRGVFELSKEFAVLRDAPNAIGEEFPDNELIQSLLEGQRGQNEYSNSDGARARTETLAVCRQVADILARKAPPDEATEYKYFVVLIASEVAKAAPDGTFLGLGLGKQNVSSEEAKLLKEIATALGISSKEQTALFGSIRK